jgi:hypothetical protein
LLTARLEENVTAPAAARVDCKIVAPDTLRLLPKMPKEATDSEAPKFEVPTTDKALKEPAIEEPATER